MFAKATKLVLDPEEQYEAKGYEDHLPKGFWLDSEWKAMMKDKLRLKKLMLRYDEYNFVVKEEDENMG